MNNGERNNNNEAMNNEEEQGNNNEAMNIDDEQDNESESMNNYEEQRNNNVRQVRQRRRARINYNCAKDFHEKMGIPNCQLPSLRMCPHCNAQLFYQEIFSLCCSKRNIVLPLI